MKSLFFLLSVIAMITSSISAYAESYGGIEFPMGIISFADEVVTYDPGTGVNSPYNNPAKSLGAPDSGLNGEFPHNWVALGDEGSLVLKFTDNFLTTSGDSTPDLWIFESGGDVEPTDIWIGSDSFNWIYLGSTNTQKNGFDIDAYIGSGVSSGGLYSYVKIVDLLPTQSPSPYPGADIDAVGAATTVVPEPISSILFITGGTLLAGRRYIKRRNGA